MNTQRGEIATVWLYAGAIILILLALAGAVKAWESLTFSLDKQGYDRGVAETNALYTARDNAQLQAVIKEKDAAILRAKQLEDGLLAEQKSVVEQYDKGVKDGKAQTAARRNAVRDGSLVLRDPGSQAGNCPAGNNAAGEGKTPAAGPGDNAAQGAKLPAAHGGFLSSEASTFLIDLTGEADEVAKQLALAQARIRLDLKLCNAP